MHCGEDNFEREIQQQQQEVGQLDWDMSIIIVIEKKKLEKTFARSFYKLTFRKTKKGK